MGNTSGLYFPVTVYPSDLRSGVRLTTGKPGGAILLGLLVLCLFPALSSAKDLSKLLAPHYRNWLNKDVAYIITNEERDAFLQLTSDETRDQFIERFWEIRNPTPGSPDNSFKAEHYRRIAYANQWFGHNGNAEGWRTDRGRVYITLGEPQQVGKYLGFANIRPMEIWFYSNGHPALPPFFYVVFYQREVGDEFRLYSPFMDGPEKLVHGPFENDRLGSWKVIDHDAGREVSRTVLSLIPTEPVDLQTATSSMTSDMLLNNIRGLANHPLNKEILNQRRSMLESVTHRVVLKGDYLDIITVPLVDASGETNLHYVLRLKRPDQFTVAEDKEKRYYSASVTARVLTPDGKLIFSEERKLSSYLDDKQFVQLNNRVFGYESVLPLPPGKYKLEFQLSDEVQHTSFPDEREIVIPERPTDGIRITDVVPFSDAATGSAAYLPFSAAGVRFIPAAPKLSLAPGQDLEFFYQLWAAPTDPASLAGSTLDVQYAYGRMGMNDTKVIKDSIVRNQFDPNGSLINGKKIPTTDLPAGDYRMAITVEDPAKRDRSVASFQFRVTDSAPSPQAWDVTDPQIAEDVRTGRREYKRALCYLAQNSQENALVYLEKAYKKSAADETRNALIEALYTQQAFDKVVGLYSSGGITPGTSEQSVFDIAESLNRLGQVTKSIQVLESALSFRQSSTLYLGLARYYQASGDHGKASEMEKKAKSISPAPSS